jgi:hypothetical protein
MAEAFFREIEHTADLGIGAKKLRSSSRWRLSRGEQDESQDHTVL